MKKIFVAYADEKMSYSLKRIGRQAKKLGIFDEIRLMTPQDLSEDFRRIKLMQYSYGGGYWAWKPYIINRILQENEDGTIVCYVDSGCTLREHSDWSVWNQLMQKTDTILFEYPDKMDIWDKFGTTSTKIKHWVKKESFEFYNKLIGSTEWSNHNKILGGIILMKGKDNAILHDWLDIIINRPELIIDPSMCDEQYDFFAQHKHDQPLLVALSHKHRDQCFILPETAETCGKLAAIEATRVRAQRYRDFAWLKIKDILRKCLGLKLYSKLKQSIKK